MATTQRSSFLAAVLSLIIPGLGQLYKGRFLSALLWFLIISALYGIIGIGWPLWFLFPIPIGLQIICIIQAFLMEG